MIDGVLLHRHRWHTDELMWRDDRHCCASANYGWCDAHAGRNSAGHVQQTAAGDRRRILVGGWCTGVGRCGSIGVEVGGGGDGAAAVQARVVVGCHVSHRVCSAARVHAETQQESERARESRSKRFGQMRFV